jgi:hypothetical protein
MLRSDVLWMSGCDAKGSLQCLCAEGLAKQDSTTRYPLLGVLASCFASANQITTSVISQHLSNATEFILHLSF